MAVTDVPVAGLSAAHLALLEAVTRFVDDEVVPVASERDRRDEYPADLVARMKQLGLFGACLLPLPLYALVNSEIARGWVSLAPALNAHSSMVWVLKTYGTPEQQDRWLDDLVSGRRLAALGLTEPEGGSDLQAVSSSAVRTADGWRVTAHKSYITHSAHADLLMLLVLTDPGATPRHRGLSLVVLERGEWQVVRHLDKLGTRSIETCELVVDGVEVDAGRVLGPRPGQGFTQTMDALEVGRIAVAGAAIGVGRAALWAAVGRSRERRAFGQRIGDFQTVSSTLGAHAVRLKAAQALTLEAAAQKQAGGRRDTITMGAKVFASETAMAVALAAMEVYGGAGYTKEHDVERFLRDVAVYTVGEGSNNLLTSVIGQRLLEGQPSLGWV